MTGAEIKELVANIPDDSSVLISGSDMGGYDSELGEIGVLSVIDSDFVVQGFTAECRDYVADRNPWYGIEPIKIVGQGEKRLA